MAENFSRKIKSQSELFSNRLEHVSVVPLQNLTDVNRILKRNGYSHKKHTYIATTYFSTTPSADILQWSNEEGKDVVVRFRQRFVVNPFDSNGGFHLKGGGDLEIKIHDKHDKNNTQKKSIRIPEDYGIERLIELSNTNTALLESELKELASRMELNGIDVHTLLGNLNNGLRVLTTKTSQRDLYTTNHKNTRVTVDTDNKFYAYPYLDDPVFESVQVAQRADIAKVDLKFSPENQIGFSRLIDEIAPLTTGEFRAETGLGFTQMRELALKKTNTILKEQGDYEFESKFNVMAVGGKELEIYDTIRQLHDLVNAGRLPGYRISRYFPHFERRPGESALRTIYGWVDEQMAVHEVLTLIEVDGPKNSYWIKRKGDPDANSQRTMKRKEQTSVAYVKPNMDEILRMEEERLNKSIISLPQIRKDKVAFKVEEVKTGRMFTVSLDKTNIVDLPEISPLVQLEIEYAETPSENIPHIRKDQTLKKSCNELQSFMASIVLDDISLEPTQLRKIDWLYDKVLKSTKI